MNFNAIEDQSAGWQPPDKLKPVIFGAIICLFLLISVVWCRADDELIPGGVTVGVSSDGKTPVFMIDALSVNWNDPRIKNVRWYAKPWGVAKVVGTDTKENVKTHPGKWATAGVIATLLATSTGEKIIDDVSELFSGDNKDDKKPSKSPVEASKPSPAVVVQGNDNNVTTTQAEGLLITGNGNTVTVDEFPNSGE